MGLPLDPHRELPAFDDPFAEWDAAMRPLLLLHMLHFLVLVAKLVLLIAVLLLPLAVLLLVAKRFLMRMRRQKMRHPSTTASIPTPKKMRTPSRTPTKTMMSRWTLCRFSFPFWHLMTKGE